MATVNNIHFIMNQFANVYELNVETFAGGERREVDDEGDVWRIAFHGGARIENDNNQWFSVNHMDGDYLEIRIGNEDGVWWTHDMDVNSVREAVYYGYERFTRY